MNNYNHPQGFIVVETGFICEDINFELAVNPQKGLVSVYVGDGGLQHVDTYYDLSNEVKRQLSLIIDPELYELIQETKEVSEAKEMARAKRLTESLYGDSRGSVE